MQIPFLLDANKMLEGEKKKTLKSEIRKSQFVKPKSVSIDPREVV